MNPTLFISDLHLCPSRPAVNTRFLRFLSDEAPQAEALYILGDLFEYWIGDDDRANGLNAEVVNALRALSDKGTRVFFMHGNRDFLIGGEFAEVAGLTLLPDPTVLELHGQRVLLMHGDTLCTDDTDYQRFRVMVRDPAWQSAFLARPLADRRTEVEGMRRRSEASKREKPMAIMDVSTRAVEEVLRIFAYPPFLIHGHTHRPARHAISVDGRACTRLVLPDWHEQSQPHRLALSSDLIRAEDPPEYPQRSPTPPRP
ncbi:MAG: UDP-2,3-diacylglucosamine diphosphatase [Burkholderiales bacterium]|nr:UDP-2,3-diacylglucosamine diphosphatase [Burkholderiales bacterium]